ncbi:galactose-1-phosphate uridylyltransferase [Glycomyces albidus]|uniref:Galactose-1-phosphate uridylyltransferase n=1 Tax=Glycomyces albidus TaxID=2656774 RepID=A0A6L5GEB4_9ACTN|nr:galactose-1-phosphate uridylyltransferase [Glycomyces albidus]MQM27935.1 galactose-1-phosphate uridylyltransferase [Glycomyces albidus]
MRPSGRREVEPEQTVPELRRDPLTRDWVVLAPGRAHRPNRLSQPVTAPPPPVSTEPDCPFCPGNEDRTPPELWRRHDADGGWTVRVVPNRFPLLADRPVPARHRRDGPFVTTDGFGSHEVVIEGRRHDLDLPDLDEQAVAAVFEAYRARSRALRDGRASLVLPFRNHGTASGASLPHPHSQIVAVRVVPDRFRRRLDIARAYYEDRGNPLDADVTAAELGEGTRVIAVSEHVVAHAPFASSAPYQIRITPREQRASFADESGETVADTANMVRRLLTALRRMLGDVPYSYMIISAPNGEERTSFCSWHLDVMPRLAVAGGFELGSGMAVNPVFPEQAAARLRDAMASPAASRSRRPALRDAAQALGETSTTPTGSTGAVEEGAVQQPQEGRHPGPSSGTMEQRGDDR